MRPPRLWVALSLLIGLILSLPVVGVVGYAITEGSASLPHGTGAMIRTTLALLLGVGLTTGILGVSFAWLVTGYDFPGRRVFSWLLVLPLAMPAYILGFVFLSTFSYAGPVQRAMRAVLGDDIGALPIHSVGGAVIVLSLTLYPYVYLMARAGFVEMGSRSVDAASALGSGRTRMFWRVVLPMARPAIAAGLALVLMETMTDFATVQYFSVKTVSVGVYLTWKGTYDLGTAIWLTMIVLGFAVALLGLERTFRGGNRYAEQSGRGTGMPRQQLTGARKHAAVAGCVTLVGVAFVLPVLRLLWWGVEALAAGEGIDSRFGDYLLNSLTIAIVVAAIAVTIALILAHTRRLGQSRLVTMSAHATTFGYAVPGAVIGIGVLVGVRVLNEVFDAGLLITGSLFGIIAACTVRYTAPAWQAVDAGFQRVGENVTRAAANLGAAPGRVLTRVHLPLVRSGIAVAATLVLIDVIKELPMVLLLRPFGFTTLSVWVYQLAAENYWALASLPALMIVAVALVPVAILTNHKRLEAK